MKPAHVLAIALTLTPVASTQIQLRDSTTAAGLQMSHAPAVGAFPNGQAMMSGGAAAGDFNADGWPDLFVIGGGLASDRLFINRRDGTFIDLSSKYGVDTLHAGSGAAIGDYDRDGYLDLYVTSFGDPSSVGEIGRHRLFQNLRGRNFVDVAQAAGVHLTSTTHAGAHSAAFGDYDLDGWLDLFVATWNPLAKGNVLFRNQRDRTFKNVTSTSIGTAVQGVHGFTPAFADMDGDLWPELLLAGDFSTSRYLVNQRDGSFFDATAASGTGVDKNGMGQTVGDIDNDGRFDWYVTSIMAKAPLPTIYRGNMLYRASGEHTFDVVPGSAGVSDGAWGWGTTAVDLDQDGWQDLVEVNGWKGGPFQHFENEPARLFRNLADRTFEDVAARAGLDSSLLGRTVLHFDADRDGDQDLLITNHAGPLQYFENRSRKIGHYLQVVLDTRDNAALSPNGFQTRVVARTDLVTQQRYLNGSPSYLGTRPLLLHFGLGEAARIRDLDVHWTDGYVSRFTNLEADQRLSIRAPITAAPVTLLATSGALVSGDASSLAEEDGSAATILALQDGQNFRAAAAIEFQSPFDTTGRMDLHIDTACFSSGPVRGEVSLWSTESGRFETVLRFAPSPRWISRSIDGIERPERFVAADGTVITVVSAAVDSVVEPSGFHLQLDRVTLRLTR